MAAAALSTQQAVERAIRLAQDAVKADEAGDLEAAIAMYRESVELIKLGLQVQREEEEVDNTVLHKYSKLYSDRITELSLSIGPPEPPPRAAAISVDSGAGSSSTSFAFEDADLKSAAPPGPAPSGADEWRRPFWLMRILRASMQSGGYLSPDSRVFVPRRVWVQKGARFTAMAAKLECAQCLIAELTRMRTVDHRQPAPLLRELEKFGDTLDALQNSLARLLPYVPEPKSSESSNASNAVSKLTERFKGLAKTLDKTAARLGAHPAKCSDPSEYVGTLIELFDAASGQGRMRTSFTKRRAPRAARMQEAP